MIWTIWVLAAYQRNVAAQKWSYASAMSYGIIWMWNSWASQFASACKIKKNVWANRIKMLFSHFRFVDDLNSIYEFTIFTLFAATTLFICSALLIILSQLVAFHTPFFFDSKSIETSFFFLKGGWIISSWSYKYSNECHVLVWTHFFPLWTRRKSHLSIQCIQWESRWLQVVFVFHWNATRLFDCFSRRSRPSKGYCSRLRRYGVHPRRVQKCNIEFYFCGFVSM